MGFPPSVIDGMSLWEYLACLSGHAGGGDDTPSGSDLDEADLRAMGIAGF